MAPSDTVNGGPSELRAPNLKPNYLLIRQTILTYNIEFSFYQIVLTFSARISVYRVTLKLNTKLYWISI